MADFTEYITVEGDRWDTVAQKAYGDPLLYPDIAKANRGLKLEDVITAGTKLMIPVLAAVDLDVNLLPPWKRQSQP
jgi:nucleoid-associated protein YgaU